MNSCMGSPSLACELGMCADDAWARRANPTNYELEDDQRQNWAARAGFSEAEAKRWLAPVL